MAKLRFKRGHTRVEPILFLARTRSNGDQVKLCFRSDGRLLKNFKASCSTRWSGWRLTKETFHELLKRHTDARDRLEIDALAREVTQSFTDWERVSR